MSKFIGYIGGMHLNCLNVRELLNSTIIAHTITSLNLGAINDYL